MASVEGHAFPKSAESPSSSPLSDKKANDSDSRWSFTHSNYRGSQVLELGKAVPMEIPRVDHEPREIQIQQARSSIISLNSIAQDISTERNKVRGHSRDLSQGSSHRFDHNSGTSRSFGETSPSTRIPPSLVAPVSPLNYTSLSHRGANSLKSSAHSLAAKDSMYFATAHENSSSEDANDTGNFSAPLQQPVNDERGDNYSPANQTFYATPAKPFASNALLRETPLGASSSTKAVVSGTNKGYSTGPEFSRFDPSATSAAPHTDDQKHSPGSPNSFHSLNAEKHSEGRSGKRRRSQNLSKLMKLINEEDNMDFDSYHSESTTHLLPTTPPSATKNSQFFRDSSSRSLNVTSAVPGPGTLIPAVNQESSQNERSLQNDLDTLQQQQQHPQRKSSIGKGYKSEHNRNETNSKRSSASADKYAASHSGTGSRNSRKFDILDKAGVTSSMPSVSHRKAMSDSQAAHTSRQYSHRRNFTKKSIENMMSSQPPNYDIEDIGLPTPERKLLEKFIDSLSKLSIEVQMDDGKREEGRRRLNNALRALEGWI